MTQPNNKKIEWTIKIAKKSSGYPETRMCMGMKWETGMIVSKRTEDMIGRIYAFTYNHRKEPCIEWENGKTSVACNWDYFQLATEEQLKRTQQ